MTIKYSDDRLGFVSQEDSMFVMDNFGELIQVDFCIPYFYFDAH